MIITFDDKTPQVGNNCFIAPNATLIGDILVEDDVSIWFGAVLRGDFGRIIVKRGSSIQDNVVVHVIPDCETIIGENVTVAHGAILHGCTIENSAIIGMGSVVQDFCVIGEESMIAAGSVVPSNMKIPPRHLAAGVPATVKKEITGASLMWVKTSAPMYRELAARYKRQGLGS
ncbi:MAG: gamma carbonic anhydrase family protein [Firmicutes bacterium]|nr:gamma carbonic anhydrase family protein [Bacillota bacterium]